MDEKEIQTTETKKIETEKETTKQKNILGIISLIFTGVWCLLLPRIITIPVGCFFILIGFILGIIGLFKKPRKSAVVWSIISGFFILIISWIVYFIYQIFITPFMEYKDEYYSLIEKIQSLNLSEEEQNNLTDFLKDKIDLRIDETTNNLPNEYDIESTEDIKNMIGTIIHSMYLKLDQSVDEYIITKDNPEQIIEEEEKENTPEEETIIQEETEETVNEDIENRENE